MSMKKSQSYKIATNPIKSPEDECLHIPVVRRRTKAIGGGVNSMKGRLQKSARRISCVDLGVGSYQGWVRTRKLRKKDWDKCRKWCVIKGTDLFVYASKLDATATSRIYLPLFKVSEAKETKKAGAFKVQNSGTTFYFRCDTETEKYEWINHLSLAAIEYTGDLAHSRSTASSSGIDVSSVQSDSTTSPGYSDAEDAEDTASLHEEQTVSLRRRHPKSSTVNPPARLKSHIDVNTELQRVVTSIMEADLDLVGTDRDARRQSQLRKSLAHAGFSRKGSTKNKKVFTLRAKERRKQALEHELSDITDLLSSPTRSNFYNFLGRYPDYQDGSGLDLHIGYSRSSSADRTDTDSAADAASVAGAGSASLAGAGSASMTPAASCNTISSSSVRRRHRRSYSDPMSMSTDRQTLTTDFDYSQPIPPDLDRLNLTERRPSSSSSNRGSNNPVFSKQKYKQSITEL